MIALKVKHVTKDCAIIHANWIAFVHQQLNVNQLNIVQCVHVPMVMREIQLLNVHQ